MYLWRDENMNCTLENEVFSTLYYIQLAKNEAFSILYQSDWPGILSLDHLRTGKHIKHATIIEAVTSKLK